jgi:hypothetical protein
MRISLILKQVVHAVKTVLRVFKYIQKYHVKNRKISYSVALHDVR